MIAFRKPQAIALEDGRLLFAAISRVGKRIVLTGMYYFDKPISYENVDLSAISEGGTLTNRKQFSRTLYEPCIVIVLEINGDVPVLAVSYEGRSWTVPLPDETPPRTASSAMTVFQHDYRLIPEYVHYYRKLGVEAFDLYYNGALAKIDWSFLGNAPSLADAHVSITEWDMPYWWPLQGCDAEPRYATGQHFAQSMAINHALHCAKGFSRHMFFVDLDEFVFTPKPILEQACRDDISALMLHCWWAAPEDAPAFEDFCFPKNNESLWIARHSEGHERLKSFVRTERVDIMGVHIPWHYSGNVFLADGFLHLRGFAQDGRAAEAKAGMRRMSLNQFRNELFGH